MLPRRFDETLSWAFEGESTAFTVAVLKSLETVHAIAPALWAFEVASVLSTAERKGRMNAAAQAAFLERLRPLPVAIEHRPATRDKGSLITENWN